MDDTEIAQLRAAQADGAVALAALLRDTELPAIGWYISSTDARVEGQIYREDAAAIRAALDAVAGILGAEVTSNSQEGREGAAWTQLTVEGSYGPLTVTVYGQIDAGPAS
ncbi:MAG: hypothetical protein ACRDMV_24610 [Streptosporangiales bacterium]